MEKVHSLSDLLGEFENLVFSEKAFVLAMKHVEEAFIALVSDECQLGFCDDTQQSEDVGVSQFLQPASLFFKLVALALRRPRSEELLYGHRT